jgi:protein-disulfide isomerase
MKSSTSGLLLLSVVLLSSCAQLGADSSDAGPPPPTRGEKNAPVDRPALHAVPVDGLPLLGDPAALVTLVELVDYECPYCARAEDTIRVLRTKYGRELRVAVVESPLPMHPHARDAALVALAAPTRDFEAVHRRLFDGHGTIENDAPTGIDLQRATAALEQAQNLAASLHVHGTPTFFVNGRKITGAQPMATFETIIDEELAHARALVAGGVAVADVYSKVLAEARANPAPLEEVTQPAPFVPEAKTIGGAQFLGAADAKRTILLFTDLECPYCARLDAQLRGFVQTHPDVRVVLRHRPLPMHPHARLAAKAAMAAEAQGALAAYTAVLFEHPEALDRDALIGYANRLRLDVERFTRDLDASETEQRLAQDEALATKLGVTGTPTSFVDGRRVIGAQPATTFADALAIEAPL